MIAALLLPALLQSAQPLPAHLHLIYEALGITNEQVLDAAAKAGHPLQCVSEPVE